MYDRKQTFKNAVFSVTQIVISAGSLFLVYRYLLQTFGPELLGVWSIVMAVSSLAKIGDLGFSGGMTRFIAKYKALNQDFAILEIIETGTISLICFIVIIALVSYPIANYFFPNLFSSQKLYQARQLLPYSIASFGLLAIAGVPLSGLDGFQRGDKRNMILMAGTILYTILIFLFVKKDDIVSVGQVQLCQSFFVLLLSWLAIRKEAKMTIFLPSHWSYSRFREMFSYNLNLQFIVLSSFLLEPLTKVLLGKFGSLSMVGYFEMSSKLVAQFRSVIVNVNQVLVPVIANLNEKYKSEISILYLKTYNILFLVAISFYAGLVVIVPVASKFWLGEINRFFIFNAYLIVVAMFINTMTGPACFSNMGTGKLIANLNSHLIMGALNLILGFLLGEMFGGFGVVLAYSIGILSGSVYLIFRFMKAESISTNTLIPNNSRNLAAMYLLIAVLMIVISSYLDTHLFSAYVVISCISIFIMAVIGFKSPLFRELISLRRA